MESEELRVEELGSGGVEELGSGRVEEWGSGGVEELGSGGVEEVGGGGVGEVGGVEEGAGEGVGAEGATGGTLVVSAGDGAFGEEALFLLSLAGVTTGGATVVSVVSAAALAAARAARSAFVGRPRFFLGFASGDASAGADAARPASDATFSSVFMLPFPFC